MIDVVYFDEMYMVVDVLSVLWQDLTKDGWLQDQLSQCENGQQILQH